MKKLLYILLLTPIVLFAQDNYSLSFDGSNKVILNDINLPSLFTIETNIKVNPDADLNYSDAGAHIFSIGASSNTWATFAVGISNNTDITDFPLIVVETGHYSQPISNSQFPLDQWVRIVITYDNSHLKVYQNGLLVLDEVLVAPIGGPTDNVFIGSRGNDWQPTDYNFNGNIDFISYYNRIFTEEEIQCATNINNNGLSGHWNFNEGSGDTVYDLSANGNDGIISGAIYNSEDFPEQNCNINIDIGDEEQDYFWHEIIHHNFDGSDFSYWDFSNTTIFNEEQILGELSNETVNFMMEDDIPSDSIKIEFDLYIINSWDGNHSGGDAGPDFFHLTVNNVELCNATFSNHVPVSHPSHFQSYPNNFPYNNPAQSGSFWVHDEESSMMASMYKMEYIVPNLENNLIDIQFSASLSSPLYDESWGIDNFKVSKIGNWTVGCMDSEACNYNPEANMPNGSCDNAELGYDCEGNITEYVVGMEAEGGIVFYADETGERGLVAAMETINGYYQWGCDGQMINGADELEIGFGLQNSNDIIEECSETLIAAEVALGYEASGFDDWYLPSLLELSLVYEANPSLFIQEDILYLTSSQTDANYIWSIRGDDGFEYSSTDKDGLGEVTLPIRAFGNWTMGCMDSLAYNFNPEANMADGSCTNYEEFLIDSLQNALAVFETVEEEQDYSMSFDGIDDYVETSFLGYLGQTKDQYQFLLVMVMVVFFLMVVRMI